MKARSVTCCPRSRRPSRIAAASQRRSPPAARSESIATFRTLCPLGTMQLTVYDTCMDNHNHTPHSRDDTDQHVSDPSTPLVSEMLPAFLDHLRVEEHRTPSTLIRYESHIQKFITMVGDCPISGIT